MHGLDAIQVNATVSNMSAKVNRLSDRSVHGLIESDVMSPFFWLTWPVCS